MTNLNSPQAVLASLWEAAELPSGALEFAQLTGQEPVLPSSFALGTAAQASIAAAALAAAEFWTHRGGSRQRVHVPMRHAALEFRSERYFRCEGLKQAELWDKIAGLYCCSDGRWVRLHTNFPHHRDGVLALLQCGHDRAAVARALSGWNADEFEQAASERGLCVAMARSFDEWDRQPQAAALTRGTLIAIDPIGAAPARVPQLSRRPLSGIRVLDLTRIIAGPVCARTLAVHGADVLHVSSPNLPSIPALVIDTGRGKRSCFIDLRTATGQSALEDLVRQADVFVQGYRPGALAELGFGPERLAELRPGIVAVSLSAYGEHGPWAGRRGFDSLVQTATGINWAEAQAEASWQGHVPAEPKALPAQALDHSAGYLMAFAATAALTRQVLAGGSWHVQVSLAQCARWLRSIGRVARGFEASDPAYEDIADVLEDSASGFGSLRAVRHAAQMESTPPYWARPSVALGAHPPEW